MKVDSKQLIAFLVDADLGTKSKLEELEKIAKKEKKDLETMLIKEKIITAEELVKLQAYILGIPFVNLENEIVPVDILQIIPEPIARKHNIIAFRKKGRNLEVAMTDPEDVQTIEFIRKKSNLNILPRLTNAIGIKTLLKQYQKSIEEEFSDLFIGGEGDTAPLGMEGDEQEDDQGEVMNISTGGGEKQKKSEDDLAKEAEDLPVIKIVDTLLRHAIAQSASDIHIEPAEKEVIVRYRIDGILHDAMVLPKKLQDGIVARIKVLSSLRLDEHRLPQDGRFKIETKEYKISFRVSLIPVYDGEKIVMRLLREGGDSNDLEGLGLHGEVLERVFRAIRKPNGMFLVTGPTGSGKTTTLYTGMGVVNTKEVNIATIEDPIEYRMPGVNQTQVNAKIGLTFSSGLRALLRQDPNVIMVGEIRDEETASLAINAALTGHLVFSTLHTNSASGALPRLIDMGVEPFLIASTVNAILAQRLVRKLCIQKEKYKLSEMEIKDLALSFDLDKILVVMKEEKAVSPDSTWESIDFYKAKPSQDCASGYKGRVGLYEVLEISDKIKELILQKASYDDVDKIAKEEGMMSMVEDGFVKAARGYTSLEEVLRITKE